MWKFLIIVCVLGNPCVVMEEDPLVFYKTESECMANASAKHSDITNTFKEYGHRIQNSTFDCEQDKNSI